MMLPLPELILLVLMRNLRKLNPMTTLTRKNCLMDYSFRAAAHPKRNWNKNYDNDNGGTFWQKITNLTKREPLLKFRVLN